MRRWGLLIAVLAILALASCVPHSPLRSTAGRTPTATGQSIRGQLTATTTPQSRPTVSRATSTVTAQPTQSQTTATPTVTAQPTQSQPTATPMATRQPICDQRTVDQLLSFRQLPLPQHLHEGAPMEEGEVFDVNECFFFLTHLSMQQGYVLDYVYYIEPMGGEPILYARPETDPRYQTFAEFNQDTGITINTASRYDYLLRVQTDGTQEGYLELILLRIMGGQFYLYWHAAYNDHQVICSSTRLQELVSELRECEGGDSTFCMTQEQARKAEAIRVEPVVELAADTVTVQVITFTKWGGFMQQSYTVKRSFPHEILDHSSTTLVPYECGVMF